MSWMLRRATPDDVDAIMAIETSTFTTDAWSRGAMLADVSSPHTHYLVAVDPDAPLEIVGYAGMLAPAGGREADIQTIAVTERSRGTGLGRQLMQTLVGEARRRGARELFLEVRADNPVARGLYESLGFAEIAVRPHYYQPDGVDAVVMRAAIAPARTMPADATAEEQS